jgi:hypothetical protein
MFLHVTRRVIQADPAPIFLAPVPPNSNKGYEKTFPSIASRHKISGECYYPLVAYLSALPIISDECYCPLVAYLSGLPMIFWDQNSLTTAKPRGSATSGLKK